MNLTQHFLTKNDCYTAGKKITVKGLMIHSTGVNNPKLSRYIDDPSLGTPSSGNWNQPKPGGREVCVHGFIGLDKEGDVRTIQTLPWNHRGWHSGGSGNNTHIGVEICEGDLNDAEYFAKVYKEAVELFTYLCKEFNLTEKNVTTHCEGYKNGIASNHSDVMHWFPKHGKSIDTFRADIKAGLNAKPEVTKPAVAPTPKPVTTESKAPVKSIDQLAQEVIKGLHGSGDAREKSLGAQFDAVQKRVNEILSDKPAPKPQPTVDDLAQQVIAGKLGGGDVRKKALGDRYDEVQKRVNEILGAKKEPVKSIRQLALEVIKGAHGSGRERHIALGSQYDAVQAEVNRILRSK